MKKLLLRLFGFTAIGILISLGIVFLIVQILSFIDSKEIAEVTAQHVKIIMNVTYAVMYVSFFTAFFHIVSEPYKWPRQKKGMAYIFTFLILTMLIPLWLDGGQALYNGVSSIIELIVR